MLALARKVVNGDEDEAGRWRRCSRKRGMPRPRPRSISWTEFLAEEQGRRLSRKPQPASTSLFEWGLSQEQEREAELVGAGH